MNILTRLLKDRKNLFDEWYPNRTVKEWKEVKRIYHKEEVTQTMNVAFFCATKVPIMDTHETPAYWEVHYEGIDKWGRVQNKVEDKEI